jgi:hypothetical protein
MKNPCDTKSACFPSGKQALMEQARGIEPPRPAWEAGVLPLNYACDYLIIISQICKKVKRCFEKNLPF